MHCFTIYIRTIVRGVRARGLGAVPSFLPCLHASMLGARSSLLAMLCFKPTSLPLSLPLTHSYRAPDTSGVLKVMQQLAGMGRMPCSAASSRPGSNDPLQSPIHSGGWASFTLERSASCPNGEALGTLTSMSTSFTSASYRRPLSSELSGAAGATGTQYKRGLTALAGTGARPGSKATGRASIGSTAELLAKAKGLALVSRRLMGARPAPAAASAGRG